MLLAVDIGNTNIAFGFFSGKRLVRKFNIPTPGFNPEKFKRLLGPSRIDDVILCSVVPQATCKVKKGLGKALSRHTYIIGKDIKVPVKNLYRYPKQVGADRLVNAYAAIRLYGAPLVAIDFGTAITFDLVSRRKEYLGGMILPGLAISLDSLAQRTALLPRIELKAPAEFIGRDTKSSILSGMVYGFAALTDGLIEKMKKRLPGARVIATGGNIQIVAGFCRNIDKVDKSLTLKGLNFIYQQKKGPGPFLKKNS
ncbi:MAG: type III pantothenate kinase [Candidatus Omnitrophica bacterium]|nr:type III pantothenate kinase [Candidatus Omnitrophota bacterium]